MNKGLRLPPVAESRVKSQESGVKKHTVNSYRDLIVWQKAHELTKEVIGICVTFPNTDEAKVIKKQLLRSVTSIPANIAEGYGGNKGKVFQNSLTIARRETGETDYWLLLSHDLGYINTDSHRKLEDGYKEIRAMLSSLIFKLEKTPDS